MSQLEKSILATLTYYHILGRPLTIWEIWRYLISPPDLPAQKPIQLKHLLGLVNQSQPLKSRLGIKNGFYFLKGGEKLVKQRIERQKIADQKWKKVKRIVRLAQILPYLRSIQVSGSLAINNPKINSDIDLLIVAKPGRIWTARALLTLFAYLTKQYRHKGLTKDRLCLNHYLTENSLQVPHQSIYNAQTYFNLVPIAGSPELANQFQKSNQWLGKYLANYSQPQKNYTRLVNKGWLNYLAGVIEFILDQRAGDWLELWLKKFQIRRIKKDPLTYQAGGRIIFTDQQLEFHPNSPEKRILQEFNLKLKQLRLNWPKATDSGLT